MNAKAALLLGFLIGIAAGGAGMFLANRPPSPGAAPAAAPSTNAARELAAAVNDLRAHERSWWDMDAPTPDVAPPSAPGAPVVAVTNREPEAAARPQRMPNWEEWRTMSQEDRERRFASFWSNQQVAARASFISNAVLGAAEAVRFDVLTTAMNLRLHQALDPVIQQYQSGWRPSPEDRTRLALEVSAILVDTYDEMDRNMPAGWREGLTNAYFSLTQFVEPQYMPFMRGVSGWHGRGGPGGPPPH